MQPVHARSDHRPVSTVVDPFASPHQLDPALRQFLHSASDQLTQWLGSAAEASPLPLVRPQPQISPSQEGADMQSLLDDLQTVMDGAFQPSHPGSLAHLDPPPLTASIAAELICAGLNNNLLAEELSPGLSNLEQQLCGWFCSRLGLPEQSGGVLASGGTLSNLMGLVVARSASVADNGVFLCSRDAHVSLQKAAIVMGLPAEALQQLPVDVNGTLSTVSLEEKLQSLKADGIPCHAVVATAGTTVRGAVDPLENIADLCAHHGIWLHVDAAIGGVFALSSTTSWLMKGLNRADSITLNPQKLLGITKTSSLFLVRDKARLRRAFATGLPYMESPTGEHHGGEVGLQGTRPAEVLKLWLGLRQLGENGITAVLEGALDRRRLLMQHLSSDDLELLSGDLHLLAFRPRCSDADQSREWSDTTRSRLLHAGFLLSRPQYDGHHWLKAVLGNPHTTREHLRQLADLIQFDLPR